MSRSTPQQQRQQDGGSSGSSSSSSPSASTSFLTLILDLNPLPWAASTYSSTSSSPIASLLPVVLVFLNAHLALSHSNGLAVYACSTGGRARLLYSTASSPPARGRGRNGGDEDDDDGDGGEEAASDASTYQHFAQLSREVMRGVKGMMEGMRREEEDEKRAKGDAGKADSTATYEEEETALVKALSMGLSHLNRILPAGHAVSSSTSTNANALPPPRSSSSSTSAGPSPSSSSAAGTSTNSRILVLSLTPSASNQYIGLMNCIFAAQRRDLPIDVLKLAGGDTVFLQQAASLTGGIYFRLGGGGGADSQPQPQSLSLGLPRAEELLQLLLTTYLPPPALRRRLHLPTLDDVDFRASCFCHGEIVDVGYVCGVCLSIFCEPHPRCFICNSPFPRRTLKRFRQDLTVPRGPAAADHNGGGQVEAEQ